MNLPIQYLLAKKQNKSLKIHSEHNPLKKPRIIARKNYLDHFVNYFHCTLSRQKKQGAPIYTIILYYFILITIRKKVRQKNGDDELSQLHGGNVPKVRLQI